MSVNNFVSTVESVGGVKTAYKNDNGQAVVEWEGNPYDATENGQRRIVAVKEMAREMELAHVSPRGDNRDNTRDKIPMQYFEPVGK